MRVIILQDIENLGNKGDVKRIADGYARNFLIPKGLVKPATRKALLELAREKELMAKKAEEELKAVQELVSSIDGIEIEMKIRIREDGKIYGSITPYKISQKLKEKGFGVKKSQIKLAKPIKELGEYPITITFDHGLEAEIKLIVTEEKEKKEKKD